MADSPLDDLLVKPLGAEHGPLIDRPGRRNVDPLADLEVAPTLGGESVGRRPNIYSRSIRSQLRKNWQRRLTEDPSARLTGPAMNAFNALPGMELVMPENNPLIQEYQAANPTESFVGRSVARSIPYMGLSRIMNTVPRAVGSGTAIEGADAFTRGDDPAMAAMVGGAAGLLGNIAPRAVTPRSRRAVNEEWRGISRNAHKVAEDEYDEMVRNNRFYVYRDPALARTFSTMAGAHGGGMPRIDRKLDRQHYIHDTIREYRTLWEQGEIPTRQAGPFTRSVGRLGENNPLTNAVVAGITGHLTGGNPLLYGAIGAAAGPAGTAIRNTAERAINSPRFNRWYSNERLPEPARNVIQGGIQGTVPEYLHDRTQTLMGDNMPTLSTEDIIRALRGQ